MPPVQSRTIFCQVLDPSAAPTYAAFANFPRGDPGIENVKVQLRHCPNSAHLPLHLICCCCYQILNNPGQPLGKFEETVEPISLAPVVPLEGAAEVRVLTSVFTRD